MADGDIKSISISVNADTRDATKNIGKLISSLTRLSEALGTLRGTVVNINTLVAGLERLQNIDLSKLPEQMEQLAKGMSKFTGLDKEQARSMNAFAKAIAASMRVKELAVKQQNANTAAQEAARRSQSIGRTGSGETKEESGDWWDRKELKSWSLSQFGDNISTANAQMLAAAASGFKLTNVLKPMFSVALKAGAAFAKMSAQIGKIAGKVAISPFKKLASSIGGAVKKLGGFLAAVKRIAVYRAIRAALKEITQAFKEGMQNLYQYSKAIDGTFAKSMDSLATSALYAKNSLGAMSAPIVNVLAPAVDVLTDRFVDLLNTINELVASLTGADTWTAALKYPTEYAEEMDSAAGSAKKLRATLLGFDEINRLDDNNKGSRGKAGDNLDYSKMFEERTVSNQAKGLIQSLKDAFASGDLTDLGTNIGEAIKHGLDSINWDSIKESFNQRATMVATFINGLVNVEGLGSSVGETIAEVFNVAVGKMGTFFHKVEWDKVGSFVGEGFNSIVSTFDIVGLADTLATIINSAVSMVGNFINKVNWNKFGRFLADGINKFFSSVNAKELAQTISNGLIGALKAASSLLRNTDFEQIGKKVGEFIKGIKWKEVLFESLSVILNAISATARLIWGTIKELFGGIAQWFADIFAGAWKGIKKAFSAVGKFFSDMWEGITSPFRAIGEWFKKKFTSARDEAQKPFVAAGTFFTGKADLIKAAFTKIPEWFKEKFDSAWGKVKGAFASVGEFFSGVWNNIKGAFKSVSGFFSDLGWNAWRALKKEFSDVGTFFSGVWYTIKSKFTDIGQKIGNAVGKAFATAINAVLSAAEKVINAPISAINALIKTVNKLPGVDIGKLDTITIKKLDVSQYAKGGSPDTGSLFLAGERGAELIASNNGKTKVSNRDQIADSVAAGSEETVAVLREQNALLRIIASKDFSPVTTISTDSITNALNRQNRRVGTTVIPVGG